MALTPTRLCLRNAVRLQSFLILHALHHSTVKAAWFQPLEAAMQLGFGLQQARELEAVVSPMRAAPSLDSSAADGDFARLLDSDAAPSRQLSGTIQSPAVTRLYYAG